MRDQSAIAWEAEGWLGRTDIADCEECGQRPINRKLQWLLSFAMNIPGIVAYLLPLSRQKLLRKVSRGFVQTVASRRTPSCRRLFRASLQVATPVEAGRRGAINVGVSSRAETGAREACS
jgi:hypothetical protein